MNEKKAFYKVTLPFKDLFKKGKYLTITFIAYLSELKKMYPNAKSIKKIPLYLNN